MNNTRVSYTLFLWNFFLKKKNLGILLTEAVVKVSPRWVEETAQYPTPHSTWSIV